MYINIDCFRSKASELVYFFTLKCERLRLYLCMWTENVFFYIAERENWKGWILYLQSNSHLFTVSKLRFIAVQDAFIIACLLHSRKFLLHCGLLVEEELFRKRMYFCLFIGQMAVGTVPMSQGV